MTDKPVRLEDLLGQLRAAIEDQGPQPRYHRGIMQRHRAEWPTLWRAIDALLAFRAEGRLVIERDEQKALIEEAIEDIESWGAYADDYFKKKWGLTSDIAKWRDRLDALSTGGDRT